MFNTVTIKTDYVPTPNDSHDGVFAFVTRDQKLIDLVRSFWDFPENICLKVFHFPSPNQLLELYVWGKPLDFNDKKSLLFGSTIVQNIVHFNLGKAPRVYKLFFLEYNGQLYPAQVMDYVEEAPEASLEARKKLYLEVDKHLDHLHLHKPFFDLNQHSNVRGDKLLDFQGSDTTYRYREIVKGNYIKHCTFANNVYQPVDELEIGSFRAGKQRVEDMRLTKLLNQRYSNPSVLDIGCSGGYFLRWFEEQGARKLVGADYQSVVVYARDLANYLGNFGIDFIPVDFGKLQQAPIGEKFDIVLFLSMYRHIGFPDWIMDVISPQGTMVFEVNGDEHEPFFLGLLSEKFSRIEKVGDATDFDGRSIFHCSKPKL